MPMPYDLALLIDHESIRDSTYAIIFKRGAFQTNGIFDLSFTEEFVHRLVTLFDETQQLEVFASISVVNFIQARNALDARPAPRSPKLHQNDFPAQARQSRRLCQVDPVFGGDFASRFANFRHRYIFTGGK